MGPGGGGRQSGTSPGTLRKYEVWDCAFNGEGKGLGVGPERVRISPRSHQPAQGQMQRLLPVFAEAPCPQHCWGHGLPPDPDTSRHPPVHSTSGSTLAPPVSVGTLGKSRETRIGTKTEHWHLLGAARSGVQGGEGVLESAPTQVPCNWFLIWFWSSGTNTTQVSAAVGDSWP